MTLWEVLFILMNKFYSWSWQSINWIRFSIQSKTDLTLWRQSLLKVVVCSEFHYNKILGLGDKVPQEEGWAEPSRTFRKWLVRLVSKKVGCKTHFLINFWFLTFLLQIMPKICVPYSFTHCWSYASQYLLSLVQGLSGLF